MEQLAEKWQKILGLQEWHITYEGKEMNSNEEAQIDWWDDERRAHIAFNESLFEERILVHELLHLACRHLVNVKDFVTEEFCPLIDYGTDNCVKELTLIFMRLFGEPEKEAK